MSEPPSGPRRSARNAAKRVAEKVEEVANTPAPKKSKAAPKSKANPKNSKPDVAESATAPELKDASVAEEPTKAPSAAAAKSACEALKEGDELPSDLPAVTKHTGEPVNIQDLVKDSKNGIVIFSYPKGASP